MRLKASPKMRFFEKEEAKKVILEGTKVMIKKVKRFPGKHQKALEVVPFLLINGQLSTRNHNVLCQAFEPGPSPLDLGRNFG